MKTRLYTYVYILGILHIFFSFQAWSCKIGYYTDGRTYDQNPAEIINEATNYTPVYISDIATYDLTLVDVLMVNVASNNGPSESLLGRLTYLEIWIRSGGKMILHDRSAGNADSSLLINASSISLIRNSNPQINLSPYGTGKNALIEGEGEDRTITDGMLQNTNGFALLSSLPSTAIKYLVADDDTNRVAAFHYPLGTGYIYYSGIPLDYYFDNYVRFSDTSQPTKNYCTVYTPNLLDMICKLNIQTEPEPQMGDTCDTALALTALENPFSSSTKGYLPDFYYYCGNYAPDLIFYVHVPEGYQIKIQQTSNTYDSQHSMRYGGGCPGEYKIACVNDPDTSEVSWLNLTGYRQVVYWIIGAYQREDFGDFTFKWELTKPDINAIWKGNISNKWDEPDNWDIGHVPNEIVGVTIQSGALHYPQLNGPLVINYEDNDITYRCRQLTVEQGGQLTTNDKVVNYGTIHVNGGNWKHQDNNDNSIVLENGSLMEINDGKLSCGDSDLHHHTDLLVKAGGHLVVNGGELEISDSLIISDGAYLTAVNGHIAIGTYTGQLSESTHEIFEINGQSHFYVDQATIEIKRSGDINHPGLLFHEDANISLNNGTFLFSNASEHTQTLYARFNGHTIPNIGVQMSDNSHELVFCDAQNTIGQLTITGGLFRLNGTHLSLNGNTSPAIVVGSDSGILLVDSGTLSITQNKASLTAIQVQSGGQIEIQSNGIVDRQVSIADNFEKVFHINNGGSFHLNGGSVYLSNQHSQYAWGITVDQGGLFSMTGGTFNNDAAMHCYGTLHLSGGRFNLTTQTDESQSVFNIYEGATIHAHNTFFDHFSLASGQSGIHVYNNAFIGESIGNDDNDFDHCTFQNWHPQGQALTVDNTESFTMTAPIFQNTGGNNISKETEGRISVTAYDGNRSGELFDAEPEGAASNHVNWDDTVSFFGINSTGTAIHPANGQIQYYASKSRIEISGMAENGDSILWIVEPSGATIPEYGESSSEEITLLKNAKITWYSGTAGQWLGLKSTQWNDPSNWADHKVPTKDTHVHIDSGCSFYPVLNKSLSINNEKGELNCLSISLASGTTMTTNANVYCYSEINIQHASWQHFGNTLDSFQINAGGKIHLNHASFMGPGVKILNDGQFEIYDSTVDFSYGIHNEHGAIYLVNSHLNLGSADDLDDISFKVFTNTLLDAKNSTLVFQGDAGASKPCIQFNDPGEINLESTDIIFKLRENLDTMHADLANKTLDNVYIRMPKETQIFKLVHHDAKINHLFVEKGIFDINGNTLSLLGDQIPLTIGNENDSKAQVKMSSGKISINKTQTDIALHIIENGHFLISGGTFERNIEKNETNEKLIWIESGIFEQTGGTVILDNQYVEYHWDVFIESNGTFKLNGGIFQSDGRITCNGLMNLEGGTIKMLPNSNQSNALIHILDNARILAQNTIFQRTGILVYDNAFIGTDSGDDHHDFDHCTFQNWSESALTCNNTESFTITTPIFNQTSINISKTTPGMIEVIGLDTGSHGGEAFDSDSEGEPINIIHWEDTRTLLAKSATALAITPTSNQIVYYAAETTAYATGQLLTGSVINWVIEPDEATSPSEGESSSAEFSIKENATITWYSGVPGHWTGKTSTEWLNPENWSDHRVPNYKFDVLIPSNSTNFPVLNDILYVNKDLGTIQCRSLSIEAGATLTVRSYVMAYSQIEIHGNWVQETNTNLAIQLFDSAKLKLENAKFNINHTTDVALTDILIHDGATLSMQDSDVVTQGRVVNYGNIEIDQINWQIDNNFDDAIDLQNGSMTMLGGVIYCGSSAQHSQTDIHVGSGASLTVNNGTIAIVDAFKNNGHFVFNGGNMLVGTSEDTESSNSDTRFDIQENANFTLNYGTIKIKGSTDKNNPGLYFHNQANITMNGGEIVFSNASPSIQKIYAIPNQHDLPLVTVNLTDHLHEIVFADSHHTINQLVINRGTLRLDNNRSSFTGSSPAIQLGDDIGDHDARLIVENGSQLQINQNIASLQALIVQSDGIIDILSGGSFERQLSIDDSRSDIIYIKEGGAFYLNGGSVTLNNQHSQNAWGMTIDTKGLFQMNSGTFNNDASIDCYGVMRFLGGTFNLVSQTDETGASFQINNDGQIEARGTIFDRFSQVSNKSGILINRHASIGESPDDDDFDFDGCTFKNWHLEGLALTVDNFESFTIINPVFENSNGSSISTTTAHIYVTGSDLGTRGGEAFDAEIEGSMRNQIHWPDTISLYGKESTAQALNPDNGTYTYYAANTRIIVSGQAIHDYHSLLWEITPSGSSIPESGESSPSALTLLKSADITWYSGYFGLWTGEKSTAWTDKDNWHDHKVPDLSTDVVIPNNCQHYPELDDALSINGTDGTNQCKSLTLQAGSKMTSRANVYCYSRVHLTKASWYHTANHQDSFQIFENGQFVMDESELFIGDNAPLAGLTINNEGKFQAENNSIVKISHGIHLHSHANVIMSDTNLSIGFGELLTGPIWHVTENANLQFENCMILIMGCANIEYASIQFHPHANILLHTTPMKFVFSEFHDDIIADFGDHTLNDVYLQMVTIDQSLKLDTSNVQVDHLFIEKGCLNPNGNTIQVTGDDTAIVIGSDHPDLAAKLEMNSGNIQVNGQMSDICAMHIRQNGIFSMAGGTFSRNISIKDSFDKVIWVEGTFIQSDGTVLLNNQHDNEHWNIWIQESGKFQLSGGTFENDSRIKCYGLMIFEGGHIKVSSSDNETEAGFEIFAYANIQAKNTKFSRYSHSSALPGINLYQFSTVGDSIGDDDFDFDNCEFEDWHIKGYALSISNGESFTITNPTFTNSDGYNINTNNSTQIYVTGTDLGNRGGEQFDCDPEGSSINTIHWENTRQLIGKDGTATAISPKLDQTYYYGKGTTVNATGRLLTGTSIHWLIMPPEAAIPSNGHNESASFTINENAEIVWYSGFPGKWTGAMSSDWNQSGNWSDHKVPDHTIDVTIESNAPNYPILNEPLSVNSVEGSCQCRSLKLLKGTTLTTTSRVIAYSGIELNEAEWIQETSENEPIVINNGGSFTVIDSELTVGQPSVNPQTCVKINHGGTFHIETGLISIADRLHVASDAMFEMSGGKIILGTESHALSKTNGTQVNEDGLFHIESNGTMNISGGTIELKTCWDQTKFLKFDLSAQVLSLGGEWIFKSYGSDALNSYADFGGHEVYQVRVIMGHADHCLMLSDHEAWFNELKIQKGRFELNSQTLSFTGPGPSIIIGDQSGVDDASLRLTGGEQILINQPIANVKALLIQDDGHFIMSGGQLTRDVFVEDDFNAVIHVIAGGIYEQTGGNVVINNQSSDHYWGIWIDNQASFYLHGGAVNNDARTWCFGHMNIMDATYVIANSENEKHASFSVENSGNIQAKNATFSNIFSDQGIEIKSGATIGQKAGDDDFDFDQCHFKNWKIVGSALTVENSESFTIDHAVFDNSGGINVNKQSSGQIRITGQSTGNRGGERYDSDAEGGLTNYIQWDNTVRLTGQSVSGEAVRPANLQTLFFESGSEISATGKGFPLSWEITPSDSVSNSAGENTPAEFVLTGDATITWYSIKPGMWRGYVSSDWHNPNNWDDVKVPTETDDVTIPYTCTHAPIINAPAVCADLSMKQSSQLSLLANLTVNGHLYVEQDAQLNSEETTLEIHGDWLNDGIFNAQTGTVVFAGYSNCQIIQSDNQPLIFNRLVIDKEVSAILSFGVVFIQNELILKTGIPHFTSPLQYDPNARLTYAGTHDQTTGTELSSEPLPSVIHINTDAGVLLSQNVTIKDSLLFTKGYLILGDYNLHIKEHAVVDGSFSSKTSIVTNGSGALTAEISQPDTLFFPVGSISENAGFAPFTIVFHEGEFNDGQVRIQTVNDKPIENNSISNYSDQYWQVLSSGIENYTCTIMADLHPERIQGESLYFGRWDGQNWYVLNAVQNHPPKFSGEVNDFGLFSGGEYNTFASRIILSGYMDHFCGVQAGGTSMEKNYAIIGYNLLDDIIIMPPEQFEISTQSESGFITYPEQLRLSPINSQLPETQIYVRFRPSGSESVQEDILHTSVNALTQKVLASGSGIFIRTITLSAPTPSEDIQVKLVFDPEIFEYDHVIDGGADIRFRKGNKNLPYWIQKWNPDGESIIWVRVFDAGVSSFDMEYGKDVMPPASNGADTFVLFDDFSGSELDSEKWQTQNVSVSMENGSLKVQAHNNNGGISSKQSFECTDIYSYAAIYKASVTESNYFTLFGFSAGNDPWVKRTGIYGYMPSNRFGKQSGATSTSHETNKSIALYDENIMHLFTVVLNQGFGFDDNYLEHEGDPVVTAHAAISTYNLGGNATVDWMFVYKNATPQISAIIGSECNMPGGGIWLGNISSDWSNPQNWNTGGVPKGSDNVEITPNCPNMPRLSATANCKNIEIKRNASLSLSNYQLNVYGEWNNTGTLIPQNGAVCFKGSIDVDASGLGSETHIVGNVTHTQQYDYSGYFYLGYKFKITEDITVFSFRRYFGREVTLWSDQGTLLATATIDTPGGKWSELTLPEPLTLTGNESYVIAAYTGGEPYHLSTEIESDFPYGKIQESRYSSGSNFPSTLSSVQWWMVDLIYKKGSGTGFENFHQLIVQKSDDHYVELKNVHIENRLTIKSGHLLIKNLLTYSPDAALEYAIDTTYTTDQEFPDVDGPKNLIINASGTVHLNEDRQINGRVTMVKGELRLGSYNFHLGPDASVKDYGENAFIVTNGTGKLRQYVDKTRTCVFPLGYTTKTPLTIDIQSAQLESQAYIDVSLQKEPYSLEKPPNAMTPLNRYWQIDPTGISDMSCHIHAVYADENIPQTTNEKYFMGDYSNNDQWHSLGRVDLQANSFEGDALDPRIVTAYEYDLANHLPSGANKTVSIMENESYLFTEPDFGFSDHDPYDTFNAIRITRLPGRGRLIFQDQDVESQQTIDVLLIHQLVFAPGFLESGINYASFEFQVQDSDFGWSEASYTIAVNVIRINKAPQMNLNGPIQQRISEDLFPTSWVAPHLSANDPDGDPMTWVLVTPPEHGVAFVSGEGTEPAALQYTPDRDYFGNDQWVVGVQDTAAEPLSDTIVVEVIIESVNDAPLFKCDPSQLSLQEDFAGNILLTVTPDPVPENEKSEEVNYYIIPETNGIFQSDINEQTGLLTISAIDDKHGEIILDIVANDYQPNNAVARLTVPITIEAVNDPPFFGLDQTELSVNEDFTQTYMINVIPEPIPQDETMQSVHYYLSPSQIEFVNLSINAETGQLSVTSIPDANGSARIEIWADDTQPENNLANQSLVINVLPVNDPPLFHLDSTYVRLEQGFQDTMTISPHFENIPADEQSESPIFKMSPGSVSFANVNIDPNTGIITISSIANETGKQTFIVTATENQMHNYTATASFELNVLEKMPPLLIQVTRDLVQLDEDFPNTEIIETMMETDIMHPDRSASFSLSPTQIDFANIEMNSETGTMTIESLPDRSGIQEFVVLAVDQSDPEITAMDTFILEVKSINDPPDFQLSKNEIQCQENQIQPIIIDIIPSPAPQDETAQSVTYSISPMDSDLLDISLNALQKNIQIRPKHNQNGTLTLTVIARENVSEFEEAIQQFSVTVLDVNSPPIFELNAQSINIHEDFETIILSVKPMTQPPDEQDQEVSYSISPESLSFIQIFIDEQTGQLTFEAVKDQFGEATITLTAHESQVSENANFSKQIDVTVYSVNDPPSFSIDQSVVELVEDFMSTETVTITKKDSPSNELDQVITYRLSPKTIHFANISINETTGTVSIQSLPNLHGEARISIIADDHSDSNNQVSTSFNLTVIPENDPPGFTLSQTTVSLYEDYSGSTSIHVIPDDVPLDEQSQVVSYNIYPTDINFLNVNIVPVTGDIEFSVKPDQHGYQRFEVVANDMQAMNNTAIQYLDITVTSVNDPPLFSLSETEIVIQEDDPEKIIVNIIPEQLSADESGPVSYYLTPNSVDFVDIYVDSSSKKIQIHTLPNKVGSQTFTITGDDHHASNNTAKSTFLVSVEPLNDPPFFTLQKSSVKLFEDFQVPTIVTLTPGDIPLDERDQVVRYELKPQQSDLANFSFDSISHQLTITSLPNANGSQQITIIANDQQSSNNTFAQSFILDITPVNDMPTFQLDHNEMIQNEDFSGTQTISWKMIDIPHDEISQTVTFQLSPATCDFADIQIDHDKGWIAFNSIQNQNGSGQFMITADDGQSQHAHYTQSFDLIIQPVNDPPSFALSANALTVVEDFIGDQTVQVIPKERPSDESNDIITYELTPAETPFAFVHLNKYTGEMTFRSYHNEYGIQRFKIIANDYKNMNSSYEQQLTLTVLPENDPPIFTLSRYSVNLDEDFSDTQNILVIPGLTPSNESEQPVTYSLSPTTINFANLNINPQTGRIEIQRLKNGNGSQIISVIANDHQDQNNTTEVSFSLTVDPINDPPVFQLSKQRIDLLEDFTETQHVMMTLDPVAMDEQSQVVQFSYRSEQSNIVDISFNQDENRMVISPIANANGTQVITVIADDGQRYQGYHEKELTIHIEAVNDPPGFVLNRTNISVPQNFTQTQWIDVLPDPIPMDEVGQQVRYQIDPENSSIVNASIDSFTGKISLNAMTNQSGTQVYTVTANDSYAMVSKSFTVTVRRVSSIFVNFITTGEREGYAPFEVLFVSQVQGNVSRYEWQFGDGTSSSEANPKHEYQKPGEYTVSLTAFGADGSKTIEKAKYIHIQSRQILGQVLARDTEMGLSDYTVEVWRENQRLKSTLTDINGKYVLDGLPKADQLIISAWPPYGETTYFYQYYHQKDRPDQADELSTMDNDLTDIVFVLERAQNIGIQGCVYEISGNPDSGIPNIQVDVYSEDKLFGMTARTNENGCYSLVNLKRASDYRVSVWSETLLKDYYYVVPDDNQIGLEKPLYSVSRWQKASLVEPSDPPVQHVDIILDYSANKRGIIIGTVYKSDHTKLAGIRVTARSDMVNDQNSALSDSNGRYTITELTPVTEEENGYIVEIDTTNYPYQAYNQADLDTQPLRVVTGRTDIDFYLRMLRKISGKITTQCDMGVHARVVASKNSKTYEVFSDINGMYVIDNLLPASDYIVSVHPDNAPAVYYPNEKTTKDALLLNVLNKNISDIDFSVLPPSRLVKVIEGLQVVAGIREDRCYALDMNGDGKTGLRDILYMLGWMSKKGL